VGSQFDMFFKIVEYIDIVSRRTPLFLEIKSQKKVPKILANILFDALRHPQKDFPARPRNFTFKFPGHSPSHSLTVLRKGNESFPDSHSLRI